MEGSGAGTAALGVLKDPGVDPGGVMQEVNLLLAYSGEDLLGNGGIPRYLIRVKYVDDLTSPNEANEPIAGPSGSHKRRRTE